MDLPQKLAFVDIETTGLNNHHDRVIEVAVIRMEAGKIVNKLTTLVDPGTHLPPEISSFTGINAEDLKSAPVFRQVADELREILTDCVFVAHNVRFDYGFLKNEFKRLGMDLKLKQLCTVRLSRALFPHTSGHNLDAIISRHRIKIKDRHRAYWDADAIRQFYQLLVRQTKPEILTAAIEKLINHPSVPQNLDRLKLQNLPEKPGVYIFYGASGMPLYVGKSVNIRSRVLSHFSSDLDDSKEQRLSAEVVEVETEVCAGELSALLRESVLIKKLKPLHNRRLRQTDEFYSVYTEINSNGYQTAVLKTGFNPDSQPVGPFRTKSQAVDFLHLKCLENQLCEKLLGLEKTRQRCFKSDLGQCLACTGQESPKKYNLRFDLAFTGSKLPAWPFNGPVAVSEGRQAFIFDNWCYLGQSRGETWQSDPQPFDLDTFNILKRFINKSQNQSRIKILSKNTLEI
jgi:DNA polymerase-3 subunit epsilon